MHVTCCKGEIRIEECTFLGLMDDPINVHGCCVTADEVLDSCTLRCRYRHEQAMGFQYFARQGDELVLIDRKNMAQLCTAKAETYTLSEAGDTFVLSFAEPLPEHILALISEGERIALDNLTNTASFICKNNRFGSCRARGILVSTPKKVQITGNYFASSGSAILVAGDSNYWFESGECHDVEIAGNVFTDVCLSSMYQFCDGMISICPVVPEPDTEVPYHKNIRIHDNVFDSPETPVLYGFSCGKLEFTHNRIFRSPSAERWHPEKHYISLRFCNGVTLADNQWIGFDKNAAILAQEACANVKAEG